MKAYFVINEKVYTEDTTTIVIFLNKLSKGRGATFAEEWYMKLANPGIPDSEKTFKSYARPSKRPLFRRILKTEPAKLFIPSTWISSMETLTSTPLPLN